MNPTRVLSMYLSVDDLPSATNQGLSLKPPSLGFRPPSQSSSNMPSPYVPTIPSPYVPTIPSPNVPTLPSPNVPTLPSPYVPTMPSPYIPTMRSPYVPTMPSPYVPTMPSPYVPTMPSPYVPTMPSPYVPTMASPNVPTMASPNVPTMASPSVMVPTMSSPYLPSSSVPTMAGSMGIPSGSSSTYFPPLRLSAYASSMPSVYLPSLPSPGHIRIESSSQPEVESLYVIRDICRLTSDEFSRYDIFENILGEGAYGKVYEGRDKQTSERVAIKIQNRSKIFPSEIVNIRHECNVLSTLDHPNIIKIYGGYDDGYNIYWVLSYMRGGDLMTFMTDRARSGMNIAGTRNIFGQLIAAIDYCHSNNIIHRDIKLENILLRDICVSAADCHIVLGDFGLATYQTVDGPDITTFPGTVVYVSPEIAMGTPYRGRASDIWAMGVLLYVLTQFRYPFLGDTNQETIEMIISYPPEPMITTPAIKNLLDRMLDKNPNTRMTMEEIKSQMF